MISTFNQPVMPANAPSLEDREHQKERLLENVHNAIKQAQYHGSPAAGNDSTSLTIQDTSFHQLCRHLDHAFLHGLRYLANGYWLFVKEFTHKGLVDHIQSLKNVTTNLGKGRAWLHVALNENTLESYIRSFSTNQTLSDKYYVPQALVRDEQRLQMLITMVAGLEFIPFQLEIDCLYLDHSIIPAHVEESLILKKDNMSFSSCSLNSSIISQGVKVSSDLYITYLHYLAQYRQKSKRSCASLDSPSTSQDGDSGIGTMESSQVQAQDVCAPPSPCSSASELDDRLSRILVMDFSKEQPTEISDDGLEVVHVLRKNGRRKKKSSKVLPDAVTVAESLDSESLVTVCAESESSELCGASGSLYERTFDGQELASAPKDEYHESNPDVTTDSSTCTNSPNESINDIGGEETSELPFSDGTPVGDVLDSSVSKCESFSFMYDSGLAVSTKGLPDSADVTLDPESLLLHPGSGDQKLVSSNDVISAAAVANGVDVKPAIKLREKSKNSDRRNPAKRVSFEIDLVAKDLNMNYYGPPEEGRAEAPDCSSRSNGNLDREAFVPLGSDEGKAYLIALERGVPEGQENPDISPSTHTLSPQPKELSIYDSDKAERTERFHRKTRSRKTGSVFRDLPKVKVYDASQTSRQFSESIDSELREAMNQKLEDVDVKVDNNTLLRLMLDVFVEEEQLYKMYHATIGHTEDLVQLLFIIMTDKRLYFLEHGLHQREFTVAKVIAYSELDYILLGINYQTALVVCKRRRKRYHFCTGDEYVMRSIISSLELAIRRWCPSVELPGVFTDAVMQTIGLKKWIAQETGVERHEASVLHYSLINWTDPQFASSPQCPAGPSKDGHFMFRMQSKDPETSILTRTNWAAGYFVLRAGILYQFTDKDDRDLKAYIRLHSPDFQGCRRSQNRKRPHMFEILLGDDKLLELAAANEYEASEWLQAFLQTASLASNKMFLPMRSLHTIVTSIFACRMLRRKFGDDEAKPCTACCLVLTPEKILVCQEDLELFTFTTLGSAHVSDLVTVYLDSEEPCYCVLEFESVEASVCAGDWVLYFSSADEQRKFISMLETAWTDLFKITLPLSQILDEVVQRKCRDHLHALRSSWKLGFDMLREPCAVMKHTPSPM